MKQKLKIAVTGGIGGGKSAFCKFIEKRGYKVFSADRLAKEIMMRDGEVKNKIIKTFGKDSYSNGILNNKYLAERVFIDPESVKKINKIVHPAVIAELNQMMNTHLREHKSVFVEAALIYEAKMEEMFDYVIVVTADEDIRKKRAAKKGIDEEEFERRKLTQLPEDKKKNKADFVFENNGTEKELETKADFLLKIISV
jgi:dephospho-CoA kinase